MTIDPNHEDAERIREVREQRIPGAVQRQEWVVDRAQERQVLLYRLSQLIWLVSGIVLSLMGIRFILKLVAANPANVFAALVYQLTNVFLWPFFGLTITPRAGGVTLEFFTLVAILIYALITWAVVKLIWILFAPGRTGSVTTYHEENR